MCIKFRLYQPEKDYSCVGKFLLEHYQPGNEDGNWLEPAWEYNRFHPSLDFATLEKIGIWEDCGKVVAVAHCECTFGEAFFQFAPAYRFLHPEMLDYAEENLCTKSAEEKRDSLRAYVNERNEPFLDLLKTRGYQPDPVNNRPMCLFAIPDPFPAVALPEGFQIISLADECDWAKVHRVMWRGFNHEGEPPAGEDNLEMRRKMFDTPSAQRSLKIVVRAPNGEFASFCGMFCVPSRGYAYVEPVATDPSYRRMGLGRAAVLEGIRRCAHQGARLAYVWSDQEFYLSMGFKLIQTTECWIKHF